MKKTALMFRSPFVIVLWVFLAWFIVTFLIVPNVGLLVESFQPKPGRNAFQKLLASDRAMQSLFNSVLLAFLLSVTVNLVGGVFIALVTQYFKVAGSRILWLGGYATTFLYGGVVLVTAYKSVYGKGGVFEALFGGLGYSGGVVRWPGRDRVRDDVRLHDQPPAVRVRGDQQGRPTGA